MTSLTVRLKYPLYKLGQSSEIEMGCAPSKNTSTVLPSILSNSINLPEQGEFDPSA